MIPFEDPFVPMKPGVVLNPALEDSITRVRLNFAALKTFALISSGFRDPHGQVFGAIYSNCVKAGIVNFDSLFADGIAHNLEPDVKIVPPGDVTEEFGLTEVYWWQFAWSHLLNLNYIVNPAFDAICLENSIRPDGTNRKGQLIHQSPHTRGTAVDYTTHPNGQNSINDVHAVLIEAKKDPLTRITNLTFELQNHCVHSDIMP